MQKVIIQQEATTFSAGPEEIIIRHYIQLVRNETVEWISRILRNNRSDHHSNLLPRLLESVIDKKENCPR